MKREGLLCWEMILLAVQITLIAIVGLAIWPIVFEE